MSFINKFLTRRHMKRDGHVGTRKRRKESEFSNAADHSPVLKWILVAIMLAVCVAVLLLPEWREYPKLVINQLAPTTLFARTSFSYEDKEATRAKLQEALNSQPHYFRLSEARNAQVRERLRELFEAMEKRRRLEQENKVYAVPEKPVAQEIAALSPAAFQALSYLGRDKLLKEQFENELQEILQKGMIDLEKLPPPRPDLNSKVRLVDAAGRHSPERSLGKLKTYRQAAAELTVLIESFSPEKKFSKLDITALERLMLALLDNTGNLEQDSKLTAAHRKLAAQSVKKVMIEVNKNDILIKRNAQVTPQVLVVLEAHDAAWKLRNHNEERWQKIAGNLLWSLVLILFAVSYLSHIHPEITGSNRSISIIVLISAISLGLNWVAMETFYFFSGLLSIPPELVADALPLALPAVLLTVMAGYRVALYIGLFTAMVTALMLDGSFSVALEGLLLSASCGLAVRDSTNYRAFFLRSFFCVLIAVFLLDFNIIWHITQTPKLLLITLAMATCNALFTSIAAMLITFLFELGGNVSTNMSLMVLCDGNHELLKKLHLEATGTSVHSQNVAMIAETAAKAIGCNAVLVKAGALFHDIGKKKNPEYFIENDPPCNPHDKQSPTMSSNMIRNHVKEGIDLALKYKICAAVRQFIERHHGTDLIQYFYHQAKNSQEQIVEADYRYPGPLPNTKELVIVSLADACEAACRSLEKKNYVNIKTMVDNIFLKRWNDGQLDEAELTIKELAEIKESFIETLTTMHHVRPAYPKDENSDENDILIQEHSTPGTK